jgi:predicted amidohydrolase
MERLPGLDQHVVHSGIIIGGDGIMLRSPKVQDYGAPGMAAVREFLPDYLDAFGWDSIWPVLETPFGAIGIVVGTESLVPEAARMIAARRVRILVQPLSGADDTDRALPFDTMLRAAAYANGLVVATAGAPGELSDGELRTDAYDPHSAIYGPDGETVAAVTGRGEGFVVTRLPRSAIESTRAAQARDTTPAWDLYRSFYGERPA